MEVRPGYKQTEVGVIPVDWVVKTVGEISEVKTGPFGSALHEKDYVNDGTPIITVEHLGEQGVLHRNIPMVSDADKTRLKAYSLRKGDIVFSRVGSVDRNALIKGDEEGWLFSGRLLRVRLNEKDIDSKYLSYHFHSEAFKQRVRDVAVGQTMASINTQILMSVNTNLPPNLAEQQAIAEALSDADVLIESLEQLIAKKRQIKQGAMQELLSGKRRLPGFNTKWKKYSLGQIGKCHRGVSYNPSYDLSPFDTESTIRLLRANNVQGSQILLSDLQYVHAIRVSENQRLRSNDILVCMANGNRDLVGKAGRFVIEDGLPYTFGAFMSCFRPDSIVVHPGYVFYIFQTEKYRSHIATFLAGSSINNLTPSNVESLIVNIPTDYDEQNAIAIIINGMDAEIAALEDRLAKTRLLKQGMMQELLTGRIRLESEP